MRKLEGWKAVVSVPSQRKAWEVYPLEVFYPDDPTRLCRPKAGQSLYTKYMQKAYLKNWERFEEGAIAQLFRNYQRVSLLT